MASWLSEHWMHIGIPALVFVAITVLGLWLRLIIHERLVVRPQKSEWVKKSFIIESLWNPFLVWFALLGVYVAMEISVISADAKRFTGEALATMFVLSLIWAVSRWSSRLIRFYVGKSEATQSLTSVASNITRVTLFVIGILVIFNIWGVPTFPITLIFIAFIFLIVFAFRNTLDNFLAGLEIAYGEHIKVGHLIKLGTGETGRVTKISWIRTVIQTHEGNLIIIPNYKLMTNIIVNHGAVTSESVAQYTQSPAGASKPLMKADLLSDREREVLKQIGMGATNREIAEKLIISEHTVKSHLRSILSKLNLRNRQQAAAYAERQGLSRQDEKTDKIA